MATRSSPLCASCAYTPSATARFCEICGSRLIPPATTEATTSNTLASTSETADSSLCDTFAVKLWDKLQLVSEHCRTAKHSAKALAALCTERAAIEASYALELRKLVDKSTVPEIPTSTLGVAVAALRASWAHTAAEHAAHARALVAQGADPLTQIRERLKARRAEVRIRMSWPVCSECAQYDLSSSHFKLIN